MCVYDQKGMLIVGAYNMAYIDGMEFRIILLFILGDYYNLVHTVFALIDCQFAQRRPSVMEGIYS